MLSVIGNGHTLKLKPFIIFYTAPSLMQSLSISRYISVESQANNVLHKTWSNDLNVRYHHLDISLNYKKREHSVARRDFVHWSQQSNFVVVTLSTFYYFLRYWSGLYFSHLKCTTPVARKSHPTVTLNWRAQKVKHKIAKGHNFKLSCICVEKKQQQKTGKIKIK